MNHRKILLIACSALVSSGVLAKPESQAVQQAAQKPGIAVLKQAESTIESVSPELANIVVLCAHEEKKKFEKEWQRYVGKHHLKGEELDKTIAWVSDEAIKQRRKTMPDQTEEQQEAWLKERRKFMSDAARRAMNPAR